MSNEDLSIVNRIRQGDSQSYAVLVDRYKDRVFSLVLGIVRSREVAEEVAQDVFIRAYSSINKFRGESSFSTWLYRIAYNTAISETRKRKMPLVSLEEREHLTARISYEEEDDFVEERHQQLKRAITELNPEEQLILQLYYREEKSVEDLSLCLNQTNANIKIKLFRLRNKIRSMMDEMTRLAVFL
ncbi:MAG: sigma-70 family RNA polymerase sigma factor [Bacteroidetes bacterium]|nr:sigma-70 family RNA polymerase sigma factor [Bacteroidota bacterium]